MTALSGVSGPGTASLTVRQNQAITAYASGDLSPARHDLMSCAVELNSSVAESVAVNTAAAAALMMEMRPVAISPLLIGDTLARLSYGNATTNKSGQKDAKSRLTPKPLRDLLNGAGLNDIKWKSLVPGIAVHDILGNRKTRTGDRMYLLRAKSGLQMPEHSHHGEEWTLILTGSYRTETDRYCRGDLHISDAATAHAPHIDEGEDCICLVVTQGQLHMKRWVPKLLQQVVGI